MKDLKKETPVISNQNAEGSSILYFHTNQSSPAETRATKNYYVMLFYINKPLIVIINVYITVKPFV